MYQAMTSDFTCDTSFNPALCPAFSGSMREITEAEIEMVGGGILPFVIPPIVITGAKIAGVAFTTGFFTTFGSKLAESLFDDQPSC